MKKIRSFLLIALLALPSITFAGKSPFEKLVINTGGFVGKTVFGFLLAIAFLVFVYNVVKFFIIQSDSADSKSKARNHIIYSVAAIVFIIIFWGLTNLLVDSIGLEKSDAVKPDYIDFSP